MPGTRTSSRPARKRPGTVSARDIALYRTNGFVKIAGMLTAREVKAFRAAVDHAVELRTHNDARPISKRTKRERVFTQCTNLWEEFPDVRAFTLKKRIARAAAKLIGTEHVRLWHDHALYKEAGGSRTPWHVDQAYWPLKESTNVTCWIALTDVGPTNGGMGFIPGSHKLALKKWIELDEPENLLKLAGKKLAAPRFPKLKAGDRTFHHGYTVHAAAPNKSKNRRKAFAIIYVAEGSIYIGKPLHGIAIRAGLKEGKPVRSKLMPRVV